MKNASVKMSHNSQTVLLRSYDQKYQRRRDGSLVKNCEWRHEPRWAEIPAPRSWQRQGRKAFFQSRARQRNGQKLLLEVSKKKTSSVLYGVTWHYLNWKFGSFLKQKFVNFAQMWRAKAAPPTSANLNVDSIHKIYDRTRATRGSWKPSPTA